MMQIAKYKYFSFFATLYISLLTCSTVLGGKLISTRFGVLAGASLVSPFWYIVGDIIAEVYGFKIAVRLFWSTIICQFIFSFICFLVMNLPSPQNWNGQAGYELVLGSLLRISLFQFIGVVIAWNINVRLLTRWKVLLKGKYFWLRSSGSSILALVIFSLVSVIPTIYGKYPVSQVVTMVIFSCIIKIVFTVVLSFPSSLIVFILKSIETAEVPSYRKTNHTWTETPSPLQNLHH